MLLVLQDSMYCCWSNCFWQVDCKLCLWKYGIIFLFSTASNIRCDKDSDQTLSNQVSRGIPFPVELPNRSGSSTSYTKNASSCLHSHHDVQLRHLMKPEIRHSSASTLAPSLGLLGDSCKFAENLQCQKGDGEEKVLNCNFTNGEEHLALDGHSFSRIKVWKLESYLLWSRRRHLVKFSWSSLWSSFHSFTYP